MNADDSGRTRGPADEPVAIGEGVRDLEARLRASLEADARQVAPSNRLDAILTAAHTAGPKAARSGSTSTWLGIAAAAAVVAVLVGTLWLTGRQSGPTAAPAGTVPSSSQPQVLGQSRVRPRRTARLRAARARLALGPGLPAPPRQAARARHRSRRPAGSPCPCTTLAR